MRSSATKLTLILMTCTAALTTGCADAIREGAVGGIGSAVEGAFEQVFNVLFLPLQTLAAA